LFQSHRPKTVSVYAENMHPDITPSFVVIKDPFGIVPRPLSASPEAPAEAASSADTAPFQKR
jgi:hypothetical protein